MSALSALLVALFLFPLAAASPVSAAEAETIHGLVNQSRWDDGLRGLIRNPEMDAVALSWAKQLAASGALSHNPDYSSQIPEGWRSAGENVAKGYSTAQTMHDGWMSSPGHKANILGAFTDIGIAFYESDGTTWGVQVFATYPGHVGEAKPDVPAAPPLSASSSPTPSASAADSSEEAGSLTKPSTEASGGSIGATDGDLPPTLSQAELQASVYGHQSDHTWIAWIIFASGLLLGGAGWFFIWRKKWVARPVGRRARE